MNTKELIKNLRSCASPNECGDCPYFECGCMDSMMEEAADTIERLTKERGWISVEERLPEAFDTVLISVLCKNGFGEPARLETIGFLKYGKWHSYTGPILGEERVTHWMPFPSTEGLNET